MILNELETHGYTRETCKLFAFSKQLRMATLGSLDWLADVAYPRLVKKPYTNPRATTEDNLLSPFADIMHFFRGPVPPCTMHALYKNATADTLFVVAQTRALRDYCSRPKWPLTSLLVYASKRRFAGIKTPDHRYTPHNDSLGGVLEGCLGGICDAATPCHMYLLCNADFSLPHPFHKHTIRAALSTAYVCDRYSDTHNALVSQAKPKEDALDTLGHMMLMCVHRPYSPAFKAMLAHFIAVANIGMRDLTNAQRLNVIVWGGVRNRPKPRDTVLDNGTAAFEVFTAAAVAETRALTHCGTRVDYNTTSIGVLVDSLQSIVERNRKAAERHTARVTAVTDFTDSLQRLVKRACHDQQEPIDTNANNNDADNKRSKTQHSQSTDDEIVSLCNQME
jgi:hypothetical protein